MAPEKPSITVNGLPAELLALIFEAAAGPVLSDSRLHNRPSASMLQAPHHPAKSISLVCRRWHALATPILFRHVVWPLAEVDPLLTRPPESSDPVDAIPLLAFLRSTNLARHVVSFTIIISKHLSPATPVTPTDLPDDELDDPDWIWHTIFSLLDPLKLTLIATPETLARLFRFHLIADADLFPDERLHLLSLSRDSRATTTTPPPPPPPPPLVPASALVTLLPWTHLLLNENSFIPVYRTYHYFDRRPPSILRHLLTPSPASTAGSLALLPPTLRSLAYVAIFPLTAQLLTLVRLLPPGLDELAVHLVPPRNNDGNDIMAKDDDNVMVDAAEMHHVQPADLWLERDEAWTRVLGALAGGDFGPGVPPASVGANWRRLRRFEMGGVYDDGMWGAMVGRDFGEGWEVGGRGVLVKRDQEDDEAGHELDGGPFGSGMHL